MCRIIVGSAYHLLAKRAAINETEHFRPPMKVTGLSELVRELETAQSALAELHGEIGSVSFDPNDPASIDLAIKSMERMIDTRMGRYYGNELIESLIGETKESFRAAILEKAASARLEATDE